MSNSGNNDAAAVQVVVRVRPLNAKEVAEGCQDCSYTTPQSIRLQAAGKDFFFDKVFDARVPQQEIFASSASGIINKCFDGYNGTIFAYGQVGWCDCETDVDMVVCCLLRL